MLDEAAKDMLQNAHFNSLVPDARVNRRGFIAGVGLQLGPTTFRTTSV